MIMRAEAPKKSGKRKWRWRIRDIFTDVRRSQAVLDILSTADMEGASRPRESPGARHLSGSAGSAGSAKRRTDGDGRDAGLWRYCGEEILCSYARLLSRNSQIRGRGLGGGKGYAAGCDFICYFLQFGLLFF